MNIIEPLEGETKYSPKYIYRQIFGTLMRGHHQKWPDIRLDELRRINPDTLGWIHMDGSPVNYPIVKPRRDADFYLTHNFSWEESYHGAVSLSDSGERTMVLGAHHMKDGSMFFAVSMLYFPDYYEAHRSVELLFDDGLYRADFFAVHLTVSSEPDYARTSFSSDEDFGSWIQDRKKQSLYEIPLTPAVTDRVLVMSTCAYPDDPEDHHDGIAAYAVLHKVQDHPRAAEHRGEAPELLKLVNIWNPLPEGYVPELVPFGDGLEVDRRCAFELKELIEDCRAAGGKPHINSIYRSEEKQKELFEGTVERWMAATGMDRRMASGAASWHCAPPGTSEHQLGLAADLSFEPVISDEDAQLTVDWYERNAWRYGFIRRYPEGKEDITGILKERWHYRFVGREAAEEIQGLGITLEEYLGLYYGV